MSNESATAVRDAAHRGARDRAQGVPRARHERRPPARACRCCSTAGRSPTREAGADVTGGRVTVRDQRLYRLVSLPRVEDRRLTLRLPPGVTRLRLHVRLIGQPARIARLAARTCGQVSASSARARPGSRPARCYKRAAIDFDCFEKGSGIGGNWRYGNDNGMSSAYRSLFINTSRTMMEYASYPMPADYPDYPHHTPDRPLLRRLRRPLRLPRPDPLRHRGDARRAGRRRLGGHAGRRRDRTSTTR